MLNLQWIAHFLIFGSWFFGLWGIEVWYWSNLWWIFINFCAWTWIYNYFGCFFCFQFYHVYWLILIIFCPVCWFLFLCLFQQYLFDFFFNSSKLETMTPIFLVLCSSVTLRAIFIVFFSLVRMISFATLGRTDRETEEPIT